MPKKKHPPLLQPHPQYDTWLSVVRTYQHCQQILQTQLAELDLTLPQFDVLSAVGRFDGCRQSDLANRLLLGKSNFPPLLRRMEGKGWITRERDKDDARVWLVHTTKEGRQTLAKGLHIQAAVVQTMLSALSPARNTALGNDMKQISTALSKQFPSALV